MLKRGLAIASVTAVLVSGLDGEWTGPAMAAPAASHAEEQSVHALKTGDQARLRSGRPLMTVNHADGDQATCLWSTEEGNVLTGSFAIADLTAPITTTAADPR